MAVWLDMEPSSAGYGEEEMNFSPGECRMRKLNTNQNKGDHTMAYKKPEIVAKSESKQSFVAACPEKSYAPGYAGRCHTNNAKCNLTPLR